MIDPSVRKVKTLNPVSSLATADLTFATPCCGLCEPHMSDLSAFLSKSVQLTVRAAAIGLRGKVKQAGYSGTLGKGHHITGHPITGHQGPRGGVQV
jgi:hypothetical protein